MRAPESLKPLIEDGVVDEVLRELKSGKEASVFLVRCGEHIRCAKVYKAAEHRGFHRLAEYQEGRKARGSRDTRAMGRRGRRGREVQEAEWKNAEVEALYRLVEVGVRVPQPYGVFHGVLLMELVQTEFGDPAPRLNEVDFTAEQALQWHAFMMEQVVRMLCAGLIHGDLSEYNVLVDATGPVVIDLPQAVNASGNNNAFRMLQRDVDNMRDSFGRMAPELLETRYADEIWKLYQNTELRPDSVLTGRYVDEAPAADVDAVLDQIDEARREAEARQRGREAAEAGE